MIVLINHRDEYKKVNEYESLGLQLSSSYSRASGKAVSKESEVMTRPSAWSRGITIALAHFQLEIAYRIVFVSFRPIFIITEFSLSINSRYYKINA
jgi:hypothetical protein